MAPAWSSRVSCDPTPCRAHRPPWPTSWDCATWPSRSTTCRRLSIGQLPRVTGWSVASASTRALGGWPTYGGRKGSSSRWPSASAETRDAPPVRSESRAAAAGRVLIDARRHPESPGLHVAVLVSPALLTCSMVADPPNDGHADANEEG